mmetsp:Transcript_1910/g.4030  ORF Transcript_1910/g.4030 Transcript_1910/m.4030 type:complete len:90 (+) Transcript_1910:78-347(+)
MYSLERYVFSFLALVLLTPPAHSGYAPSQVPDLPDDFCPKKLGTATATTGECMCHWQDKRGCKGSGCKFEMGLTWYHYTCKDCTCVAES